MTSRIIEFCKNTDSEKNPAFVDLTKTQLMVEETEANKNFHGAKIVLVAGLKLEALKKNRRFLRALKLLSKRLKLVLFLEV